jgi:hypothetical protein
MAGPALADIGAAGGLSLLEPLSARTAALGDAVSAEPGRADALGDNPAGLAAQPGFAGSALYHAGFAGDTWVSVTGGAPLPDGFGAGAGVALYNGGTVEALDPTGHLNPVTAQRDLAGRAGLAWQAPGWPVRAGVAATVISSQLLEDVSALQVATDWGLQAAWPAAHLAAGAALQHLGGHLRYDTGKEPLDNNHLPALWRFGLAWTIDLSETPGSIGLLESAEHPDYLKGPVAQGAGLYAEAQARTTERAVQYAAGMEYTVAGLLSFRAGARTLGSGIAARLSVPTFGLGIAVKAIVVDYAVELLPVAAIHRIGLTVRAAPKAD